MQPWTINQPAESYSQCHRPSASSIKYITNWSNRHEPGTSPTCKFAIRAEGWMIYGLPWIVIFRVCSFSFESFWCKVQRKNRKTIEWTRTHLTLAYGQMPTSPHILSRCFFPFHALCLIPGTPTLNIKPCKSCTPCLWIIYNILPLPFENLPNGPPWTLKCMPKPVNPQSQILSH